MKSLKKMVVAGLLAMSFVMAVEVPKAEAGLTPQQIVQISQAGLKGVRTLGKIVRARRSRR